MSGTSEAEARKALGRLKRAVEKGRRELEALEGALRKVEGEDFPQGDYTRAASELSQVAEFADAEGRRLQAKVLEAGGLEPGRIRRSSSVD